MREAAARQEAVKAARAELENAQRQRGAQARRDFVLVEEWPKLSEHTHGETLRMVLDSVYVKKGRGPVEDRVMILWDGEDDFEKPRRGTTDYKVKPIPWPMVETDSHFFDVPGLARRWGHPLAIAAHESVHREWTLGEEESSASASSL